jgi:hypothetical protein
LPIAGIQCTTRGIGKLRRLEERDAVRYSLRVADDVEEFQAMYGGERRPHVSFGSPRTSPPFVAILISLTVASVKRSRNSLRRHIGQ